MKIFKKSFEIANALFNNDKNFSERCFVVCCAFYKNRLIVIETNSNKTDPNNLKNPLICRRTNKQITKTKCCAEWRAIKRLKNVNNIPFSKITLVNVRITKQQKIGFSKPCSSCSNLLSVFEFKNLFYTLDSNFENPEFEEYLG